MSNSAWSKRVDAVEARVVELDTLADTLNSREEAIKRAEVRFKAKRDNEIARLAETHAHDISTLEAKLASAQRDARLATDAAQKSELARSMASETHADTIEFLNGEYNEIVQSMEGLNTDRTRANELAADADEQLTSCESAKSDLETKTRHTAAALASAKQMALNCASDAKDEMHARTNPYAEPAADIASELRIGLNEITSEKHRLVTLNSALDTANFDQLNKQVRFEEMRFDPTTSRMIAAAQVNQSDPRNLRKALRAYYRRRIDELNEKADAILSATTSNFNTGKYLDSCM